MSQPLPVQDAAPPGGFKSVNYTRNIPRRGPSGAVVLIGVFAIMTYGFIQTLGGNKERRELQREKAWARINLVPLLTAEQDRDKMRRQELITKREAEIMKNVPGWKAGDLKAPVKGIGRWGVESETDMEPVYYTKRHVDPTYVFLPNAKNLIKPQWWRGTQALTKNPSYHDRSDFTKEHPLGQ